MLIPIVAIGLFLSFTLTEAEWSSRSFITIVALFIVYEVAEAMQREYPADTVFPKGNREGMLWIALTALFVGIVTIGSLP